MKNVLLIGIDCSAVEANIGLALATYQSGTVTLKEAELCNPHRPAAGTVAKWLRDANGAALLAIDAPLGWPEPLARTLAGHRAGEMLNTPANEMFRRATDSFVKEKLGKNPLDVGADRIARTAHAALRLLGDIRNQFGVPIPLAWKPVLSGIAAIEVYPAATLVAHAYRSIGYKKPSQIAERREVVASVSTAIEIGDHRAWLEESADVLDAAVCVLGAKDFLDERAWPPTDFALAKQEGWIWFARRQNGATPN